MSRKRLVCFDLIRVFSCICVTVVHFNAQVSGWGEGGFVYPNSICQNFFLGGRVYLGGIGVSLFFILSGATLMYTYQPGKVLTFYKKRFLNIYPMFWIAFFCATAWDFMKNKGMPAEDLSLLIYSFLGLDGYLGTMGMIGLSFYKVGEWFLGCIIMLYLVFPVIRWCYEKSPVITGAAAVAVYAAYIHLADRFQYPVYNHIFFFRIPEMLLGMTFVKYRLYERKGILLGTTAAVLFVGWLFRDRIYPLTLCIALCMFLFAILTCLADFVSRGGMFVREGLAWVSGLTYPIFLVHHWLIVRLLTGFYLEGLPRRSVWMLFFIYVVLTVFLAWALEKAAKSIVARIKAMKGTKQQSIAG